MKKLLTANEAIARGFYEAGGSVASAYPGTPSTEILENISNYKDELYCEWAPNEKVALETAIGAAIVGARSLAAMKHVGLNVAADPLFTAAYTGINAGLVIICADDPECHSSQNEQDNRHYARSAKIAMLEPSNSQEAKDMVRMALEISEEYDVPVMMRTTTRVNHSKSVVEIGERTELPMKPYTKDRMKYDAIPAISRQLHKKIEKRQLKLAEYSDSCALNFIVDNGAKVGVVAAGAAYQYSRDVFGDKANFFKVGMSYPMPIEAIRKFAMGLDKLYVIEELDPFMEEEIRAAGIDCIGKEIIPVCGELNSSIIRKAVFGEELPLAEVKTTVVGRPPALCAGCPHRGAFVQLGRYYKDAIVCGDIGCYALGGSAPYNAKDCAICMGAGVSLAHGMKKAFNHYGQTDRKVVAVIGDSTFFHTGINSLTGMLWNNGNALVIILDNRTTGMTGHQENPGTGYTLDGGKANIISIEEVVRALGAKNVRTVNPLDLAAMKEALDWGFGLNEPAVIITRYPCALKKYSPEDKEEFGTLDKCIIDAGKCIGCRACVRTGCPALVFNKENKKVVIDQGQCTGCSICMQVCPKDAISKKG